MVAVNRFRPERIQVIANLLHPERVTVRCVLSSVVIFSPVFSDSTVTSDVCLGQLSEKFVSFLMGCGIPMTSAWFNKMVPNLKSLTCFGFFVIFSRRKSCRAGILCYLRKDFHNHQPHWI